MPLNPDSNFETIDVRTDGAIGRITLNRPERRNALSPRMAEELTTALRRFEQDPAIRVLTLRGAGGHFCSGGDLAPTPSDASSAPDAPRPHVIDLMNRVYGGLIRTLHGFSRPVLALVEGVAAGAGANLAFACDLVYAQDDARFSEIFVKRGIGLDCGGSWLLPRLIGLQRAKQLAYFGDWLDAASAQAIGLVTEVHPTSTFESVTTERASTLAERPPIALGQIKQSLHRSLELGLAESLEIEAVTQAACSGTEDAAEGFRAFLEKRPPRFQGR
jgi:2-(1,2-epoxy-1,2-dihydrophenyl)acetyl-CoA isomerase